MVVLNYIHPDNCSILSKRQMPCQEQGYDEAFDVSDNGSIKEQSSISFSSSSIIYDRVHCNSYWIMQLV
jgi:hypothetical protein